MKEVWSWFSCWALWAHPIYFFLHFRRYVVWRIRGGVADFRLRLGRRFLFLPYKCMFTLQSINHTLDLEWVYNNIPRVLATDIDFYFFLSFCFLSLWLLYFKCEDPCANFKLTSQSSICYSYYFSFIWKILCIIISIVLLTPN